MCKVFVEKPSFVNKWAFTSISYFKSSAKNPYGQPVDYKPRSIPKGNQPTKREGVINKWIWGNGK